MEEAPEDGGLPLLLSLSPCGRTGCCFSAWNLPQSNKLGGCRKPTPELGWAPKVQKTKKCLENPAGWNGHLLGGFGRPDPELP